MGILKKIKGNHGNNISDKQIEEVTDTNSSETSPEMEQEHDIEELVEEKDVETITSDTNEEDLQEVETGEGASIETTEMVEQQEEKLKEEEVELNVAEEVKEVVHISIPKEKEVVDVGIIEMEDIPETETELVDPLFDSSKKYYSDVKLSVLEKRLDTLLHTKKQLLSNPKPDNKKLEEIVQCIKTLKSEIEDTKYEAYRFSSEV